MSYESPVELFVKLIHEQALSDLDNAILGEVRRQTGICVDKEELIKAINYDRDQYNKGYADGFFTAHAIGHWIGEYDGYADGNPCYDTWHCSECDYYVESDDYPDYKFCPGCGAKMEADDG